MSGVSNYSPYAPNAQGFTEALIDLKSTLGSSTTYSVIGFLAEAFENINQGEAVYCRSSDGKIARAVANGTFDQANVAGFAQTTKLAGQQVRVVVTGSSPNSGLNPGSIYYLSAGTPGSITDTPPSGSGQYVTRVGEAVNGATLVVQLEPPIKLD